ncbi:nuclear transport factor 2 family protein [Marinibaculum pumilum]|uniref:Nuclear transport factor 2 family protein n=1 Tax=Marinibaculum pumilum TaxID=1766165 RepID=A0ABV7L3M3_9PROT
MHDLDAVLAANESFYRAFAEADMAAMEALWAERSPVACIHPGWPPLTERADVIESWRRILTNPGQDAPECRAPEVLLYGDMALVLCFEAIAGQVLVASNYFVQEAGGWRLVHHQSGPVNEAPRPKRPPGPRSVH